MDIHSQTGLIEAPFTTLGEQLTEASKKALEKTAQEVMDQAHYTQRAKWWMEEHPVLGVLSAAVLGALMGLVVASLVLEI